MDRVRSTVTAALLLPLLASSQDPIRTLPAPSWLTDRLDVDAAQVQELLLPPAPGDQLTLRIRVDGATRTVQLYRHDIRAPDFKVLLDDGNSVKEVALEPPVTYRGRVLGEPDSAVAATHSRGQLRAVLRRGDGIWSLQPASDAQPGLPYGTYLIYAQDSVRPLPYDCAALPAEGEPRVGEARPAAPAGTEDSVVLQIADVAVDADYPLFLARGSSPVAVQDDITGILNAVNVIFDRDLGIEHRLKSIVIRAAPKYVNDRIDLLLSEFRSEWRSSMNGVDRDIAHLFTGRTPGTSIGAVDVLGGVCSCEGAYGLSFTDFTSLQTPRVVLTAHEFGHNWGASHCGGDPDYCGIMFPRISLDTQFGTFTQQEIAAFIGPRPCLSSADPGQPPVLAPITLLSMPNHQLQPVVLNGVNLCTVTALTVGGVTVPFTVAAPDILEFTPPEGLEIRTHQVVVSNPAGSDAIDLTITGTQPGILDFPLYAFRDTVETLRIYSDRQWQGVLGMSLSPLPSIIPGVVDLQIGNNFQDLMTIPVFADSAGIIEFELSIPAGVPPWTSTYWQAVMFADEQTMTLPLEASARASVLIL